MSPIASVCVDSDYFDVIPDGSLSLKPGSMGLRLTLYFTNVGVFQFDKSQYPWLARIRAKVQAGGGGAAGAQAGAALLVAQTGGAGGGYSEALIEASALGAIETILVGAGGNAGGGNTDGGSGGNSAFGGFSTANGGAGGAAGMTPGDAVAAFSGTPGPLSGIGDIAVGGGAGGGAIRLSSFQGQSGEGGDSQLGFGGYQRSSNGGGGEARGYGGGGAGSFARDNASSPGTGGSSGIVVLELYG